MRLCREFIASVSTDAIGKRESPRWGGGAVVEAEINGSDVELLKMAANGTIYHEMTHRRNVKKKVFISKFNFNIPGGGRRGLRRRHHRRANPGANNSNYWTILLL